MNKNNMLIESAKFAFSVFIGAILSTIISTKFDITSMPIMVMAISICIVGVLVIYSFSNIRTKIEQFSNSMPARTYINKYYKDDPGFDEAIKLIKDAKEEIIIIDYLRYNNKISFHKPENEKETICNERNMCNKKDYLRWFSVLEKKVEQNVAYRRYIQDDNYNSNGSIDDLGNQCLSMHVLRILEIAKKLDSSYGSNKIQLKKCRTVLANTCMVIIDRKRIIWEAPIINGEFEFEFSFDIIIEDNKSDFVNSLLSIMNKLEINSTKIDVVGKDSPCFNMEKKNRLTIASTG